MLELVIHNINGAVTLRVGVLDPAHEPALFRQAFKAAHNLKYGDRLTLAYKGKPVMQWDYFKTVELNMAKSTLFLD